MPQHKRCILKFCIENTRSQCSPECSLPFTKMPSVSVCSPDFRLLWGFPFCAFHITTVLPFTLTTYQSPAPYYYSASLFLTILLPSFSQQQCLLIWWEECIQSCYGEWEREEVNPPVTDIPFVFLVFMTVAVWLDLVTSTYWSRSGFLSLDPSINTHTHQWPNHRFNISPQMK